MINGGGIFYETKIGNLVELSLHGEPLLYTINPNVAVSSRSLNNPPAKEQSFCAFGSDNKIHYLRVLTTGEIYSPFEMLSGIILTGYIRYYSND